MQQKWTNKLNNDEFNLIENDWYPLIKKNAMEKLKAQLHELGQELQSLNPQESFKISAGDRLQDLPYLVLDFPKIPNPQFTFVCRTLFWWGRGVQFQLIYRGANTQLYSRILSLAEPNDLILVGSNLWENDISTKAYKVLSELNALEKAEVIEQDFFKLVRFKPIKNKENLFEGLLAFYLQYANLAND
jgi:hypothetical protein